jgi:DnaJ-like protein
MPYESWVERQIREATERGEFDNLPGAGRPLPGLNGRDDEDWWIKGFLERERIPMPLPASLALRKEVTDLLETLAGVREEAEARRLVEDLNERIRDSHRRRIDGPPLVLRPVDVEATLEAWRERRRH